MTGPRVLAVSEDPDFIQDLRDAVRDAGGSLIACLGPSASPCFLDERSVCPLAASSALAIVDAPPGGIFKNHLIEIPAANYAERLQGAHPGTVVLLSTDAEGSGPTGEVMVTSGRSQTLLLLDHVMRWLDDSGSRTLALTGEGGVR